MSRFAAVLFDLDGTLCAHDQNPDRLFSVAVVLSAVDSRGEMTRPGYPERTGEGSAAFHRARLRE